MDSVLRAVSSQRCGTRSAPRERAMDSVLLLVSSERCGTRSAPRERAMDSVLPLVSSERCGTRSGPRERAMDSVLPPVSSQRCGTRSAPRERAMDSVLPLVCSERCGTRSAPRERAETQFPAILPGKWAEVGGGAAVSSGRCGTRSALGRGLSFLARVAVAKTALSLGERAAISQSRESRVGGLFGCSAYTWPLATLTHSWPDALPFTFPARSSSIWATRPRTPRRGGRCARSGPDLANAVAHAGLAM